MEPSRGDGSQSGFGSLLSNGELGDGRHVGGVMGSYYEALIPDDRSRAQSLASQTHVTDKENKKRIDHYGNLSILEERSGSVAMN
jgi:hypothetical protein